MKKRIFAALSVLLCLAMLAGCTGGGTPSSSASSGPAPTAPTKAITIVHTNDVHGYDSATDALSGQPSETVIGLDAVAGLRDALAEEGPVFLLDAGDATQGIFFVTQNKGEAAIDIMNAAGYDAMTLGNHEFDYGWFQLINLIGQAQFPILSQLDDEETQQTENLHHYTVLERDGVRLGVFGITTPETQFKSDGGFGRDFGTVQDLIDYADSMVHLLREEVVVDYVVCLAHLGVEDMGYGTSYDIRDNVEGIDLIIDGHSHTVLEDIVNVEGRTQITSTGASGARVGVARLDATGEALVVETKNLDKAAMAEYTPVADVTAVIDGWAAQVATEGNVVVAQIPFDITVARENERTGETVMGNIVTDAMREVSGADIAMQNGGGIRDQQLAAGDVTKAQLIAILPFGNVLQMAEVEGSVILELLEQGVSMYPEANGGFAHVSGMAYTFNPDAEVGSRIVSVTVGGQPLDPDAVYTLCTNDFTAAGGDLYTMLVEPFSSQLPLENPDYAAIDQALVHYLRTHQAELSPDLEGRIQPVPGQ
ncbi:5'-nucleotidase C-terminal domain-containing protein [Ruminococcaceae bacterium OttesenSCG-928-O06]|nr:5'-nucleotidase C-terminal domain-containing protein [Ruminococcaceae bacterium OttesenSCG-928-O06]